jgi:aconitate hydratase
MDTLTCGDKPYHFCSLAKFGNLSHLPYSLKVLLESVYRYSKSHPLEESVFDDIIHSQTRPTSREVPFSPARVLMQDFTGVPAVVDLAAMRDAIKSKGKSPSLVNPLIPVDLVIDHSVMVDHSKGQDAFKNNVALEYERNHERYKFLKWGQKSFQNFRVVPPGMGICHQVNLEYLAKVVWSSEDESGRTWIYPDTLVGTDSHTTMVNGLSVLGWGVGGIEAEAAMLGQPLWMLVPDVVGVHLMGQLRPGITATDLVLSITHLLRKKGVVGKFVEFYGDGLNYLSLADRATIANMAPEYGATCGFFPIDQETLNYLALTGRTESQINLVETYAKKQGLWRDEAASPIYKENLVVDLGTIQASLAGPKRPQDLVPLSQMKNTAKTLEPNLNPQSVEGENYSLQNHSVVIAAITSCTNTSNPSVMIGAGLLAKKAAALGLKAKPWVKTSLAPGSQAVTEYLSKAGLMEEFNAVGFYLVGYGCTTCIGNSGSLDANLIQAIEKGNLSVSGVLSGNRNFEGRINPHVKANYLASPPLVVAFALAGTTHIDLETEPLGLAKNGSPVFLKDIWPSPEEINKVIQDSISPAVFTEKYKVVFDGDEFWQKLEVAESENYAWDESSTYVKNPPYFEGLDPSKSGGAIHNARILALLGDSITTDHISPAGSIKETSPAGLYLKGHGIEPKDFNSYGSRRGNHEVMMRGTFANIRIQNEMVPGVTGGYTRVHGVPSPSDTLAIYDAAMTYAKEGIPLVIIAGKEYGTGSSRDWAAKGTNLLGVKAVIAESFERIHRSNLVGMGVLPLQFKEGITRKTLNLLGDEEISILFSGQAPNPKQSITVHIKRNNGNVDTFETICRIDTDEEVEYYLNQGILPFVLKQIEKR